MKLFASLVVLLLMGAVQLQAADRFVAENAGAYSSIAAAVAAATSGDRIIILPKADPNDPWDLTGTWVTNKNLTFMSNTAGDYVAVAGSIRWTVSSASDSRLTFTGIEVKNTGTLENLLTNFTVSAGIAPKLQFLNCKLATKINNAGALLDITMSNCELTFDAPAAIESLILARNIMVSGCNIHLTPRTVSRNVFNAFGQSSEDSSIFVGNRFNDDAGSCIAIYTDVAKCRIYNNLFVGTSDNSMFFLLKTRSGARAFLNNNTFIGLGTSTFIQVDASVPFAEFELKNNVDATGTRWAFNGTGGLATLTNIRYNYRKSLGVFSSVYEHSTNVVNNAVTVDPLNNYQNDFSSPAVNGGDPGKEYLDIDLSRNDAGIWGGPYTWTNFGPKTPSANPDIFYIAVPKRVQAGGTLQLKGFSNSR